jgi:hypothetical protein
MMNMNLSVAATVREIGQMASLLLLSQPVALALPTVQQHAVEAELLLSRL